MAFLEISAFSYLDTPARKAAFPWVCVINICIHSTAKVCNLAHRQERSQTNPGVSTPDFNPPDLKENQVLSAGVSQLSVKSPARGRLQAVYIYVFQRFLCNRRSHYLLFLKPQAKEIGHGTFLSLCNCWLWSPSFKKASLKIQNLHKKAWLLQLLFPLYLNVCWFKICNYSFCYYGIFFPLNQDYKAISNIIRCGKSSWRKLYNATLHIKVNKAKFY